MSSNAASVTLSGVTVSVVGTGAATVSCALPDADPEVAVTLAVPVSTAVVSPEASTEATDGSDDDHPTVAPAMTCPFWSRTSAAKRTVSPTAVTSAVAGDTSTVVATGCGGGGGGGAGGGSGDGPLEPSPHPSPPTTTAAAARTTGRSQPGHRPPRSVGQIVDRRVAICLMSSQRVSRSSPS